MLCYFCTRIETQTFYYILIKATQKKFKKTFKKGVVRLEKGFIFADPKGQYRFLILVSKWDGK